jgi:hemin uptake protein HemP
MALTSPRPAAPDHPAAGPAAPAPLSPPRYDSRALFGDSREIVIAHNTRAYRLRVTAQGKLILTA